MWTPPRVVLKPKSQRPPRRLSAHLGFPAEALPCPSRQNSPSYAKPELQGTRMRCESVTRAQRHPVVNKESAGHASLRSRGTAAPAGRTAESVKLESESRSVVPDSLRLHGLYSPWNSLGQNTRVGCLSLLQGIFLTQGSNPSLSHCSRILYQLSHQGSPLNCKFKLK